MAGNKLITRDQQTGLMQHIWAIQAALAGAAALLENVKTDDETFDSLWSAKELVKSASVHVGEMYPRFDDLEEVAAG